MHDFPSRWRAMRRQTLALLSAVTPAAASFRPLPEYRSIEQLALHLFAAELAVAAGLERGDFPWKEASDRFASASLPQALTTLEASGEVLARAVEQREERWLDGAVGSLLRRQWLEQTYEHEIHHRGQLSLMIRMSGGNVLPLYA